MSVGDGFVIATWIQRFFRRTRKCLTKARAPRHGSSRLTAGLLEVQNWGMTPLRTFPIFLRLFFLSGLSAWAAEPVEVTTPGLRGAIQPQVAMTAGGKVFVVFGKGASIYCASSTGGELKFHAPVPVASLPKLALGMRRGPRVAATDQIAVVSAISHADGNLYSWTSADAGGSWSAAVRINSATNAAREGLHGMAGDGKGNVHAVWLDLRNGPTELWGAASSDGGRTWAENRQIYRSPDGHICECCHPSVAVDGQGRVWAMWRNWLDGARDMFAAVSEDGGRTFSPGRKLGSGTWALKGCPMDGGSLAFQADGNLVSVWRREQSLFIADERGETILSGQGLHPVASAGRGGPFYLWHQGSKLMLKRAAGEAEVFAESGVYASVASSPGRAPVVVWEATQAGTRRILARSLD